MSKLKKSRPSLALAMGSALTLHSRIQKSLNALVSGMLIRSILGRYSMRVPTTLANFLKCPEHLIAPYNTFFHCDLRGQKAIQCERAKSWPVMWKLSRSVQMQYRLM